MTTNDYVLQDGQTVVMIGDSITDVGRRDTCAPLGDGYVRMISGLSAARHPNQQIRFLNMGVSGDTVRHLQARWNQDVLAQRPDWLSIAIGINDVWRQLDGLEPGVPIDEFAATYRQLLETTRGKLGGCGLILMTTSVMQEDPASQGNQMLKPYNAAIEQLANDFDAFCVPINMVFNAAIRTGGQRQWTTDGVHPNNDGHTLMALTWLATLGW